VAAAPPPPAGSEYKVLRGDTLSKIAKKFHITLQALSAANPGVNSSRLKIDQPIHIPGQTAPAAATAAPGAATAVTEGAAGQQVYTVKSNDTLTKVAREFGVKVKALRAANHLRTDKIKVGQKLKIPAKTAAEAAPAPAATAPSANPATPAPR
jgi:peptidoglycan endopeptidase LytE